MARSSGLFLRNSPPSSLLSSSASKARVDEAKFSRAFLPPCGTLACSLLLDQTRRERPAEP